MLFENKIIGLGWIVIDYDDVNSNKRSGFWTLSHEKTMFGNATALPAFRLMPLEPQFPSRLRPVVLLRRGHRQRRLVAFKDESVGQVTSWHWDFGDGTSSNEQNPQHAYKTAENFVVILDVVGPAGKYRRSKVWEVQLK